MRLKDLNLLFTMKFNFALFLSCIFVLWHGLTSAKRDPNNPPVSRTGAPGETTCGASGCHSGGSFAGNVSISGIPDTVQPSQVYAITLTHASNATKAGFELVCLDANNANCGTLATASGVSIGTASGGGLSGRKYARQSSPHTLSGGATSWTFNWTAPATITTDSIKFYFASLAANGNGQKSGDNVLLGSKTVAIVAPVIIGIESIAQSGIKLYPTAASDRVNITLPKHQNAIVKLYDLQGKQLIKQNFMDETVLDVEPLSAGVYIVYIEMNGKQFSQKITVQ